MMRGMDHVIHSAIECFFVGARWLCKSAKFPNKLERRRANFIRRRRWTEVVKCFNGSAHVRTINNSRLTINYFVFRPSRRITYFAMQKFLGWLKNSAFAKATARQAPRFP